MRIAIVEDHGLMGQTLAAALLERGHDAWALDRPRLHDAASAVLGRDPELVLLDLDLGDEGDGSTLLPSFVAAGVHVVMVTGVADPARRAACIGAGALGVVSKSQGFDDLVSAVERIASSGAMLTDHEREEQLRLLREHARSERERLAPFDELSRREAEVLGELMRGRAIERIASRSFVSVHTVRTQVRAIREKLGVHSQLAAIALARDASWEPPGTDG